MNIVYGDTALFFFSMQQQSTASNQEMVTRTSHRHRRKMSPNELLRTIRVENGRGMNHADPFIVLSRDIDI